MTISQEFNKEIGDWINYFISEGFNQPSAFLGAILMNYGTQLTQYQTRKNVQDEIDKFLTALQNTLSSRLNVPIVNEFKLKKEEMNYSFPLFLVFCILF